MAAHPSAGAPSPGTRQVAGGIPDTDPRHLAVASRGQFLFVIGDLLFDLVDRVWHSDAYPSAADAFYLSGYVPLAIGLVRSSVPAAPAGTSPA